MPSIESSTFSIPSITSENTHRDRHDNFDRRDLFEKAKDLTSAAAHRASDPDGWCKWADAEEQKFFGIGEGLNEAKEQVKGTVSGACKYMTDGTAWHQMQYQAAHPEILADKLATGASIALYATTHQRECLAKASKAVAISIAHASDIYTHLSPRAQGKVIGETMFGFINPEGNTEAVEVVGKVGASFDRTVLDGISKSKHVIDELVVACPELARQARFMLRDYMRMIGIGDKEAALAGVPTGFFNDLPCSDNREEFILRMSREGKQFSRLRRYMPGEKERNSFSWPVEDEVFDQNAVRQTFNMSCVAAVGAMLTESKHSEMEMLARLSKITGRTAVDIGEKGCDIQALAAALGSGWNYDRMVIPVWDDAKGISYAKEICQSGPWAAEFVDVGGDIHVVMVVGFDGRRFSIIDPWEGTRYCMRPNNFIARWNTRNVSLAQVKYVGRK